MRPRLSYANVVATIALFCALGGGAYAASQLPKGSVGTAQLRKNAVTAAKVEDGSLLRREFKANQLPSGERGPEGARGPQGERGPEGPRGRQGETGLRALAVRAPPTVTPPAPSSRFPRTAPWPPRSLPAGSYVLTGRANIYNNGVAASDDCSIWAGTRLDEALFELQAFSGIDEMPVAAHAAVTLAAPTTVELICEEQDANGVDMYAAERRLTAIQVGALHLQ